MSFDQATKSPRYAELMEHEPDLTGHRLSGVLGIAFCVGAALACGVGAAVLDEQGRLLCGLGALAMAVASVLAIRSHSQFMASPLERMLARVKDETVETDVTTRTTHDRAKNRRRTTTRVSHSYHLLLEFPGGERDSHEVDEDVSRLTTVGDVGVAYLKAGVLLDFKPLSDGAA